MKTSFALKPNDVLATYARRNGGDVHTRALIAMALREGKLLVRTSHRWTSAEKSILKAWKNEPILAGSDKPPPKIQRRELWWRSVRWNEDVHDWDFSRSRMIVTTSLDPVQRVMLKGVRFKSDQIRNILAPGSLSLEEGSFDRVQKKEVWRRFWHDVVILAAGTKGDVKKSGLGAFKSGDELMDRIMDSLRQEDEKSENVRLDDSDLAKALRSRSAFDLGEDAVRKEIQELRRTLGLKTWGIGR